MKTTSTLTSIEDTKLASVTGGAARSSGSGSTNDKLQLMLTQITDSIKEVTTSKNSGTDQMMPMMMMMMMMGGGGGGSAQAAAPPPPPPATNIRVNVRR